MTEHPAWWPTPQGSQRLFLNPDGAPSVVIVDRGALAQASGTVPDTFVLPAETGDLPEELSATLGEMGPVLRFRNTDLWDALATAVVRQVIRAGQSKSLYRQFAKAHGALTRNGEALLARFPVAQTILDLPDDAFDRSGMAFKRRPLRNVAEAYLADGAQWAELTPAALVDALQDVPGIGPWTARAAVADVSNDWSVYPHGDLAVRTWARRAAPSVPWPTTDAEFASLWRAWAGSSLSTITLLVLAWGSRHGDIG